MSAMPALGEFWPVHKKQEKNSGPLKSAGGLFADAALLRRVLNPNKVLK